MKRPDSIKWRHHTLVRDGCSYGIRVRVDGTDIEIKAWGYDPCVACVHVEGEQCDSAAYGDTIEQAVEQALAYYIARIEANLLALRGLYD